MGGFIISKDIDRRLGIDAVSSDKVTPSGARGDLIALPEREIGDEPTDTVREYLRSIGQHPLLTAPEELTLGLNVERWMLLKETRLRVSVDTDAEPSGFTLTTEVAALLIISAMRDLDLLRTLASKSDVELPMEAPVSVLLADPEVRRLLDAPLSDKSKEEISDSTGIEVDDAMPRTSGLSRASMLIPLSVWSALEDILGARLYDPDLDLDTVRDAIDDHSTATTKNLVAATLLVR